MSRPSPIPLGNYCPLNEDKVGGRLYSNTERNILLVGQNGAGKTTRFLTELLMTARDRSLFVFDVKGELAVQTGAERALHSDVFYINPHRMHGLPSHGYNPMRLDPHDDLFFSHLTDIGASAVDVATKEPFWTESATSLLEGFCGWEVITAKRERRLPVFGNVRRMVCEPDRYQEFRGVRGRKDRRLVGGITFTAQRILNEAPPAVAGLINRFVREHGLNELASIQSTFDTQTKWVLDPMMAADMTMPGVDFRRLRTRPTTVYVMLHPLEVRKNNRWTRMIISSALSALMRPGPVSTLFILDEFRATVGNLPILNDVWALVRGYGIQLMPIVQTMIQLKTLFGDGWEMFPSQAGLTILLGPASDKLTAEWASERCGVTTVLQSAFTMNDGMNGGGGVSENGGGFRGGTVGNSINNGRSFGGSLNVSQIEQRVLRPQDIRDIKDGHGLCWTPGKGTSTITFYAPNYWQRGEPWVRRVRKNPLQS